MMPPRATSVPRTRMTYSCESSATSSRMRTGGMTMPSSEAIWRRIVPTRASSVPPAWLVDERDEAEADRELERVERERVERGVARRGRLGAGGAQLRLRLLRRLALGLGRHLAQRPADREEQAADEQERDLGQRRGRARRP